MLLGLWCFRIIKIFAKLSPKDWTVLRVYLNSVPMKTLPLAAPLVLVAMLGTPGALAHFEISAGLSIDVVPYFLLLNKFRRFIYKFAGLHDRTLLPSFPSVGYDINFTLVALCGSLAPCLFLSNNDL